MLDNFYPSFILRHPVFLVTFVIAIPAWLIAFIGQCAAEANLGSIDRQPRVSYLWYSIWIQLAVIIQLLTSLAAASDQLALHRFQLAVFIAIAEVFAVIGTNFIYSREGSLIAVGVGWLLSAIVDLVWLLYLTSEENTPIYQLLTTGSAGGLSGHSKPARRISGAGFSGGESGIGSGIGNGYAHSQRLNGGGYSTGGGGYAPAETTPQKVTALRNDFVQNSPSASEDRFRQKAKAQYAYSASPDDPNEVSFAKGDILDVIDSTGKWFQVRTPSGQTGIAPSNYLTLL